MHSLNSFLQTLTPPCRVGLAAGSLCLVFGSLGVASHDVALRGRCLGLLLVGTFYLACFAVESLTHGTGGTSRHGKRGRA